MKKYATLFVFFYALDQLTKWATFRWIDPQEIIPVISGFFNLVNVANTGAAFGSFSNSNVGLAVFASVILLVLGWMLWRGKFHTPLQRLAITLLFAGALGNITDRIVYGHVVDFLDFILPLYGRWPAFNIADSCICVAAGLFIFSAFREKA